MRSSALGAFQLRCWLCMHYPSRGNAHAEVTRPKHAYLRHYWSHDALRHTDH